VETVKSHVVGHVAVAFAKSTFYGKDPPSGITKTGPECRA
jgi:hypothetical protein